jgi:hypothetical protein
MAATIVGITSLTFGGSAETVAVFTSFSQVADSDTIPVLAHDGSMAAKVWWNKKNTANMTGFIKGATPTIGASVTLANAISSLGGITGTFYCDSVTISKAPSNFQEVTIVATAHDSLT